MRHQNNAWDNNKTIIRPDPPSSRTDHVDDVENTSNYHHSYHDTRHQRVKRINIYKYTLLFGAVMLLALNYLFLLMDAIPQQLSSTMSASTGILEDAPTIRKLAATKSPSPPQNENSNTRTMNSTLPSSLSLSSSSSSVFSHSSSSSSLSLSSSSPACRPFLRRENRKIKRIYVAHMRKAGGTTIITYMRRVAEAYNLTFDYSEGGVMEAAERDDTFYVTFLRDPVQRTISHFKFEFRWHCDDLVFKIFTFVPTAENAKNISEFLANDVYLIRPCEEAKLWTCAANCYTRWFSYPHGMCEYHRLTNDTLYHYARNKIRNYDFIVDTNKLFTDQPYVNAIETYFGEPGLWGLNEDMFCGEEAAHANKMVPLHVFNETKQYIRERNDLDYRLYNELMLSCPTVTSPEQPVSIEFPKEPFSHYL